MVVKLLKEIAQAMRELARPETYARGAALQERMDVLRLFLVTSARETWPEVKIRSLEDVEAHAPTMAQQRREVQRNVQAQAVGVLETWLREQPPPLPPLAKLARDATAAERDVAAARHSEALAARELEVREAQRRAFGFDVSVADSGAADAGKGIFISGKATIGSLVAFYPGLTYTPADILRLAGNSRRFADNDALILRFDKHMLDASATALKLLPPAAAAMPLAVAHRANHPPAGVEHNVLPCPLDFEAGEVPDALLPLLPNVRFASSGPALLRLEGNVTPQGGNSLVGGSFSNVLCSSLADLSEERPGSGPLRGLALVALRELEDEELWLNYRLNPNNKLPPWYSSVDREEDHRRWENLW